MGIGEQIANNLIEKYNPKSVLFCPYKEEMWDSMKTIYHNMDVEKDIMPIAYYTLSNQRIEDIKIEFEYYSKNFPMLLKKGWDIIIFHYPYDQLNNVTRPLLFSNELKAFCKHLVLVPYAVIDDRIPTAQEALLPGIRNSDLVICESEEHAEVYRNYLDGQPNWHGEVVGWGSAKYDMIDLAYVPIAWQMKINGRRVVLLQTSLTPYLKNRNKLNQIENIINSYIKNNKVSLIWRPHPLYEATIKAHHKEEYGHYLELKEKIKSSPKDILDETKTCESCIKAADEMISDPSSMVVLWKHTGKKLTMLE